LEFLFFFGLVITNSRSSIGALLVGIIVVYFFINKKMIYYLFSIILFLSTTLLIGPIQKLVGLYFRLDSFSSGRDHIYDAVFAVLPHVWLFGSGPAAAKYEMFKHYPYLLNSPEAIYWQYFLKKMEFGHAHNFFLYYWTDLGILGLVLSIIIPVLFIKMGIENIKYFRNVDKKNEYLAIGIFAIGVTYFVRGFFEFGGILTYGFISVDLPFALLYLIHANMNMQVKKGSSINEK
jgi:O-antigen ligase